MIGQACNKCPLSASTRPHQRKRVEFRENVRASPGEKRLSVITRCPRSGVRLLLNQQCRLKLDRILPFENRTYIIMKVFVRILGNETSRS